MELEEVTYLAASLESAITPEEVQLPDVVPNTS
jgi:hypothetical protein